MSRVLPALVFAAIGAVVTVTDMKKRIIPNKAVLAIFGLKILLIAAEAILAGAFPAQKFLSSLLGCVICFAVFLLPGLFGKKVGAGDVKLAAACGFFLGTENALAGIAYMGILVILWCLFQKKLPLLTVLRTSIPMGPFIVAGMLISYVAAMV